MHTKYIKKILSTNNPEKIMMLEDIMVDIISYIKTIDVREYEDIECELYEIAEGKNLTEEKAKGIINKMRPYGMKWTLEETERVRKVHNISNIAPVDFWVVMNMAYNDFHDIFEEDVELYARYTKDFILDEDANEHKIYNYFVVIPKK